MSAMTTDCVKQATEQLLGRSVDWQPGPDGKYSMFQAINEINCHSSVLKAFLVACIDGDHRFDQDIVARELQHKDIEGLLFFVHKDKREHCICIKNMFVWDNGIRYLKEGYLEKYMEEPCYLVTI